MVLLQIELPELSKRQIKFLHSWVDDYKSKLNTLEISIDVQFNLS